MKSRNVVMVLSGLIWMMGCDGVKSSEPIGSTTESVVNEVNGAEPVDFQIAGLRALPRMLRVDLLWDWQTDGAVYDVRRAERPEGSFEVLENALPMVHLFSDVLGEADLTRYYQVRLQSIDGKPVEGEWSEVVSATTTPFEIEGFLTEMQEAGFRYFYDYANPVSGLPREGVKPEDSWEPNMVSAVSTGMSFFNLAVGIERGFISREEGAERVATMLGFLKDKAARFKGAFPHWLDGYTGEALPFSAKDDGADLVETAIIAQGLIFAREYFFGDNETEKSIRSMAEELWREIEWDAFIKDPGGENVMVWHWSPEHGFSDLPIVGFNEAEIAYLLGIGSPTHPIDPACYWDGWVGGNPRYFNPRVVEGVEGPISLQLTSGYGIPMFVMHYSYLGLDPRALRLPEGTLFEEFERATLAQHDYARMNAHRFKDYDRYWGLTASLDPDGYRAHHPVQDDNGTISPTGAISSIAYQPEKVVRMIEEMYLTDGAELWGPFGFYDAFNPSRDWIATAYIGIDVGPIAPMIENYRTGKLWRTFMRAPEIQAAIEAYLSDPGNEFIPKEAVAPTASEP